MKSNSKKTKALELVLVILAVGILLILTACSFSSGSGSVTSEITYEPTLYTLDDGQESDTASPETSESPDTSEPAVETTDTETQETTEVTTVEADVTSGNAEESTAEETVEITTEESTEAQSGAIFTPSHVEGAEKIGVTNKGYDVEVKDGVTYVAGIMVANKTYALPSSYKPSIYKNTDWTVQLLDDAQTAFDEMKKAFSAENPGEKALKIQSGFRSYSYQDSLFTNYVKTKGYTWANNYSARPGHSEHQTGLGADINYAGIYTLDNSFAKSVQYKWLIENSWSFGYILRYPEGKEAATGYNYEAWHFRYVGVDAAKAIWESGLCLEEFLGITSEYSYEWVPPVVETTAAVTTAVQTEPVTEPETEPVIVPVTFEPKHIKGSTKVGVSSNGYDIEVLNGVTYVGGVMLVNKDHGYPSSAIPAQFSYYDSTIFMHSEAQAAFNKMQSDYNKKYPNATGFKIFIAYRSYSYQQETFDYFVELLGLEDAMARAAFPGYSEHHTGLCCDLELNLPGYTVEELGASPEGKWLAENSWRYGFILRYPDGMREKYGFQYEPWHFTYVGYNAAAAIYQSGLCLEEFLGIPGINEKEDSSAIDSSSIESSAIDSSSLDSSSIDSSGIDSSSVDSSGIESSAIDSSAVDSSSIESSAVDSSSIDSSSTDSSAIDSSSIDPPGTDPQQIDSSGINSSGMDSSAINPSSIDPPTTDPQAVNSSGIDSNAILYNKNGLPGSPFLLY